MRCTMTSRPSSTSTLGARPGIPLMSQTCSVSLTSTPEPESLLRTWPCSCYIRRSRCVVREWLGGSEARLASMAAGPQVYLAFLPFPVQITLHEAWVSHSYRLPSCLHNPSQYHYDSHFLPDRSLPGLSPTEVLALYLYPHRLLSFLLLPDIEPLIRGLVTLALTVLHVHYPSGLIALESDFLPCFMFKENRLGEARWPVVCS